MSQGRTDNSHSGGIPSTPAMRLLIVRDYATAIFGNEAAVDAWLGQSELAVLDGQCVVSTACQTAEGFTQAIQELSRIRRARQPGRAAEVARLYDPDSTQPRPPAPRKGA